MACISPISRVLSVIHLSDDTDLIVSTLWGYIEPQDAFSTERRVNDFYRIKDCGVVRAVLQPVADDDLLCCTVCV